MARFVIGSNNSITAVLTEEDYLIQQENRGKPDEEKQPFKTGYFLFIGDDHLGLHPDNPSPWFHGSKTQMRQLLEGHETRHLGSSLNVPFSNGHMLYWERDDLLLAIQELAPFWKVLSAFEVDIVSKVASV